MMGLAAAVLFLACAAAGLAVYWGMLFWRLLPMERGLARSRGHADDLKIFSLEVLGREPEGSLPQGPNEIGQRTLSALHRLAPELTLWWITRGPGASGILTAHRGGGWAARGSEIRLDSPLFKAALERGGQTIDLSSPGIEDGGFLKAMAGTRLRHLRLVPWGVQEGTSGVLAVADPDPRGQGLERVAPFLDLARSLAGSLARIIDKLVAMAEARASLQGGLSTALEDLTDTHKRLIARTRQIKTLHEISGALTAQAAQAQSTLSGIVSIAARSLEADTVAFLLLDAAGGELVVQPGAYGLESDAMIYRVKVSEELSSSVRVFLSGEPFLAGDAQNDPGVISRYAKLWKTRSLMVAPLKVEGRCLGVMRVGSFKKDFFTKEHLELVTAIAQGAAVIVETSQLNRLLTDTAEQLASLNRIKDEFVSTVSHEFKTPLTTIMGFLTVILEGDTGVLTDQQGKFLSIAMGAAKRLAGLVSDLLDLSRLESGIQMVMKPQPLETILRESLKDYERQAASSGKILDVDISEELPQVLCDERWIATVLDNLLSNAFKFSRSGGRIAVRAAGKGEFALVSIADDGIGIPAPDQERIFEKFYRASNRTEVTAPGTGLGLAIAREVVSKHGGKIWFASSPGETIFHFILKAIPSGAGAS